MTALKIILIIIAVLIALFAIWFFSTKAKGRCPFCEMKKVFIPRKMTIDVEDEPDYPSALKSPIMGWSSWNTFRQNINEKLICEIAEAMRDSGLSDAGYKFVNLDDCWQSSLRDENGKLQADFSNFPSGMDGFIKKVNDMGLKVGLYSSNGTLTCEDMPASLGREEIDAKTVADWGCEFFKYDFCHNALEKGVAPVIENLQISKVGETPFLTLAPNDAKYSGLGRTVKVEKLPSGEGIGFISHGSGTAEFIAKIEQSGKYILTLPYYKLACKYQQYLQIKINGRLYEAFFPATKAPSPTGRTQVIIDLDEGENKIVICNPVISSSDAAFIQYRRMGEALRKASEEKPIVYSVCEWGFNLPYKWGRKAANMWRTTPDIRATWLSVTTIYNHTVRLWKYVCPGNFNDPDMLEVGNGKFTYEENKAHFSLWCMLAAPLVLGNDIRSFLKNGKADKDNEILKLVTNKELIAIDQDTLGKPAKRLKCGLADVIARPLENGDVAVCFFNKNGGKKTMKFDLTELNGDEYFGLKNAKTFEATELWTGEKSNGNIIKSTVEKHSVKVYRVKIK